MVQTRLALLLCAMLLVWLLPARVCLAVEYYWGMHPDKERLVLLFPGGQPEWGIERIDRTRLFVTLPEDASPRGGQRPNFLNSKLIESILPAQGGLVVNLRTPAFGYIHFPLPEQGKVVLDLFSDPIGAKWRPRGEKPPRKPVVAQPASKSPPTSQAAQGRASAEPVAPPEFALEKPTPAETTSEQPRRPFFAVPYTYRGQINTGGLEDWKPAPEAKPFFKPALEQASPETPNMRGKAAPQRNLSLGGVAGEEPPPPVGSEEESAASMVRSPVRTPNSGTPEHNGEVLPFVASNAFRAPVAQPGEKASYQAVTQNALAPEPAVPMQPVTAPGSAPPPLGGAEPATGAQVRYHPPTNDFRARIAATGDKVVYRMEEPGYSVAPQAATGEDEVQTFFPTNDFRAPIALPGDQVAYRAASPEEIAATESQSVGGEDYWAGADEAAQGEEVDPDAEGLFGDEEKEEVAMEEPSAGKDGEEAERSYEELLLEAKVQMNNSDYKGARQSFEALRRKKNLTEAMREEVLYTLADLYYTMHRADLLPHYNLTTDAFNMAMNHNPNSTRVPSALLRLGMVNLKVGNIREAEAYFNILRDKYPTDENIPIIEYYWGEHYYKKEEYQKAADHFQTLVQTYSDTKFVREAAVGLAESLIKLGYNQQAFEIVDYIDKRWPRFYKEYPPILRLMGDVSFRIGEYEKAKGYYWTYYNLDPEQEDIHLILARLGDIYLQKDQKKAAREVYHKTATRFPGKEGGLVSRMRLAEDGIVTDPTLETMFSVFDQPFDLSPSRLYADIVENHSDSELAPLAQVKLAMWHLWNQDYQQALVETSKFKTHFPDNDLLKAAREVAAQTFEQMVADLTREKHYGRVVEIWNKFPMIRESLGEIAPESKISVALSFFERGLPDIAEELLRPFFLGGMLPEYSEMALHLALSIYLENQAWARIPLLAEKVELWDLTPDSQRELDYSLALAFENLGAEDKSRPLWLKLSKDEVLEPAKRAYPLYFMAQEAMSQRNMSLANIYAKEALSMFMAVQSEDTEKIRNLLGILMDVAETSGRVDEALTWAHEYAKYVPREDPGWAALRYRTAQLYRQSANTEEWESILTELTRDIPESFYGRMAASELKSRSLEQSARQFAPTGSL